MLLSYGKPFNEKMCELQHFQSMIDKEKTQTQICIFGIKILSNSQNTTIFTQNA